MSQDPFEKEQYLRSKLDEYHLEAPEFPRKRGRWERIIHFLASPTKDPLEAVAASGVLSKCVGVGAIVIPVTLFILQYILFLS